MPRVSDFLFQPDSVGGPVSWLAQPQNRGQAHAHTHTLTPTFTHPLHPPRGSEHLALLPHERRSVLVNGTSWLVSTAPSSCSPRLSSCPLHGHRGTRPEEGPRSQPQSHHLGRDWARSLFPCLQGAWATKGRNTC